ncbi:2-polyprenyl-6-methoxyphenol hydroxylase-like FAD-dependent oxidoreductase [Amycolatopsis lexingtonensis]|uniref:2-polyprenyl-6-methoxyphenol hydroxylase-like FAD-dependent oxidoreductase n=1 Tax=Amycolatopsis lexingtonensis TaxID=218822 RepID=A0ABR9I9L4_9PSEU|nr:FAD-dependent monooxygenase [Amycolatopsis lexingtonensis]MBE1499864.1 2-polyprenyl-6-methoxyphenol hydroxylase-like FAD-dependent oxidoreductase [Amycolatopsis lexingtonensis]
MTKALIIGGGIAGTITAIALHEAGHEPVLFEAYDRGAEGVGAFLTLAVNGLDALLPLGLKDVVRRTGFDSPRMSIGLGDGTRLTDFPLGGALPDGTVSQTVLRSELYVALRDEAARRGILAEYGKRLIGASQTDTHVRADFSDGSHTDGELLIGADGLRSRVRTIIDPDAPPPRYVPLLNTGGIAEGLTLPDEPGVLNMVFGKRVFFCHVVSPDGRVWWFANPARKTEPTASELAALARDKLRKELLDLVSRDRTPATGIIRATREVYPAWPTYDFPSVPVWHRGRMVIIGDAAHATSPAAGQGASMAIEDAVTLAKCLRDVPEVPRALATYEGLRRERVEAVVAAGKRNGEQKVIGPVGRVVRDFFIKRVFSKPFDEDPNAFMWEHRIDWNEKIAA